MADPAGRHVVMLVRNPYTHDSRVEKEARTLIGVGFRVSVVADAAAGLPDRERRASGESVIRVRRRGPRLPGLRFVFHEARLARQLLALRPDLLHAHDSNTLLAVALAAGRLGIRFVYDAHDLWLGRPRRERGRLSFALHRAWYAIAEWLLVPRAGEVLTVSQPIARHLERRYGLDRVVLVANYPDPPANVARRSLRTLFGGEHIDGERPIVLYLGGLMAGRGLEQLVDAAALAPSIQLVMLGDGQLALPLRRRADRLGIGDRFHIVAPVPPGEVVAFAASAHVGVSPIVPSCLNYRYSLPNKLFQYMAAGIPVVASDFPQVREVIDGSRCGLVTDTSRPEAIARAIEAVLADRDEGRAMGERGRAAVAERYHWGASAQALLEAYSGL